MWQRDPDRIRPYAHVKSLSKQCADTSPLPNLKLWRNGRIFVFCCTSFSFGDSSFTPLLYINQLQLVKDADAATWDNKRTPLETVKWLCEHHTYATSSEFSMTLINNSTEAYFCKLSLPYNAPKEEWPRLCQHMHPSYYVEAKVENEETVCTQGKSSGANNPQSRYSFPDFWIIFATF